MILSAEAREIFVGVGIEAAHRLEYADRSRSACSRDSQIAANRIILDSMRDTKKSPRGKNTDEIVEQRSKRQREDGPTDRGSCGRPVQGCRQIVYPRHGHAETDQ